MLPSGWKETVLHKVSQRVAVGLATSVTEAYSDHGIPIIRNQNIKRGYFDDSNMLYLNEDFSAKHLNKRVRSGDVITVHTGSNVGLTCVVPEKYDLAQTFTTLIVTPKPKELNPNFLCYVLNSDKGEYQALRLVVGGGKGNLNTSDFKRYPLLLPPLPEQIKIAEILSTWDNAINTVQKLLTNSQQQKKALMQQLLTGKKRLLDKNGVRFSGEWKKLAIGKLIKELKKEKISNPNEMELLTVKLHYKGVIRTGKYPNATERGRPYFKRYAGELIIGRQNLHNGGVAIVSKECDGLIASNAISSFKANNISDINFILAFMSTEYFRFTVNNLAGGTGQKEIGVKDILSLPVIVPPLEEQQKIAAVLTTADQEIDNLRAQLNHLKQEKKALMQQLLTGKRRVKVEEAA